MLRKNKNLGFTLIELLIVIAIIGLLSSVVLASLNSARKKARDARRIQDFRNFSLAMEMYYDKYNRYPTSPNNCCTGGSGGSHNQNFQAVANALISEGFLASTPKEPNDPPEAYMLYDYGPGNVGQITVTYLENISATTIGPYGSCRPFIANWCANDIASTAYCICHPY